MLNIIQVKNLSKKFGNFIAVDDISFNLEKGEILAFLGPNGAGKTTTIKMLTTILNPTKGLIKINGFNLKTNKDKVRQSFGIVFQDSSLDEELTALENMQFHGVLYQVPKKIREKRIKELLVMVDLWKRKKDFVKTFSGGMKRRLEIARGLLHRPEILFLDEPTLGLDPQTRNKIWAYINQINKKYQITIFFTTHYMEEAEKMAKKIAIIDHGKIITKGTIEKLKLKTNTNSLENAFIKLTGKAIREEKADSLDKMRMFRKKRFGRR